MWKNCKLKTSIRPLLTKLSEGLVRVIYVKKNGQLRDAIATTCEEWIPTDEDQSEASGQESLPSRADLEGSVRSVRSAGSLVRYFEWKADGTPLGWRSVSLNRLVGWAEWESSPISEE